MIININRDSVWAFILASLVTVISVGMLMQFGAVYERQDIKLLLQELINKTETKIIIAPVIYDYKGINRE